MCAAGAPAVGASTSRTRVCHARPQTCGRAPPPRTPCRSTSQLLLTERLDKGGARRFPVDQRAGRPLANQAAALNLLHLEVLETRVEMKPDTRAVSRPKG